MEAKLICLLIAVVIGHANSLSYQDTFKECMKQFNLEKDDALKSFMNTGKFASDEETTRLKCFFSCLTNKLEISDDNGKIDGEIIKKLAKDNPTESELIVFASEEVQKACIPVPTKYTGMSSAVCDIIYGFVSCALETQAQSQKKP